MTTPAHLVRLQHLTGRLTPSANAPTDELGRFERTLAQHLRDHPDLTIRGNRLTDEGAPVLEDASDAFAQRIRNLETELAGQPAGPASATAPLVFRRETAFRSNLLGNSVPEWGTGMAPSASYGPFLDEHGLHVWFDLFQPIRLISVFFAGSPNPVLRVPIWGTITGRQSYRIEAGSAWIASNLIARVAALQGYYTGLKITGGSLDLSQVATASGDSIVIPGSATASLHLDLDQAAAPHTPQAAGIDAAEAVVQLPERFDLQFHLQASTVAGGDASCTVFGCQVDFKQSGQPPIWLPLIGQILVPYSATTHTNAPDHFEIVSSKSALCTVGGRAPIDPATTGWLLPAAKIDPLTRRRRGRYRLPLRDDAEGALDDVAGPRARQDHAPSSGRDRGARARDADRLHRVERERPAAMDAVAQRQHETSVGRRAHVRQAVPVRVRLRGCQQRGRLLLLRRQGGDRSSGRRQRQAVLRPVGGGLCRHAADRRDVSRGAPRQRPPRRSVRPIRLDSTRSRSGMRSSP